ncbi:ADYC domain-containing protein [Piscinibacter sp. XHJ-5]|uniref:ADYC domain-containing protein n=1 Tax=Piscinibacter sp. XHJ-5 TaxID=3037797 RepID=UPI0024529C62|nr:ADYC domain-containing protein [Piscinibacter sp. XHJ-5]
MTAGLGIRTLVRFALIALGPLGGTPIRAADIASLRVDQTEWVLLLSGTSPLRSADLVGAELRLEGGTQLRIDSVHVVREESGRHWLAHELSVRLPDREWTPLCERHSDGTRYAVVLPGRETQSGSLTDDPTAFALSCTSGALAKCLRLGYEPWRLSADGSSMRATFNACVRMIRADYSGSGLPYTENGRQIDVSDVHGIQLPADSSDMPFEAGWDEHGAVCVSHVRVAGKVTLQELEAAVPRLRGHLGPVCTEAHAAAHGALVFNRSTGAEVARLPRLRRPRE